MSDRVPGEAVAATVEATGSPAVRTWDAGTAPAEVDSGLLVSVVLPLPDHRGNALNSVRSWACTQTLPRDRYEVLIVADGSEPELEATVAAMLSPHDRLVYGPPGNETRLYDVGAREARGRWLFLTEAHCLGAPSCLAEMVRYLDETGLVGASCRSEGFGDTVLARMEEYQFEVAAAVRLAPEHWSKLFVRGAALARDVYLQQGGLKWRYRLFAEPELSSRLHAAGYRIGFATAARVRHANLQTVDEMREALHEYTSGEAMFRLDHPSGERDDHFGTPDWWQERGLFDPGIERHLWLSLLRCLALPAPNRAWLRGQWLRLWPAALLGTRWRLWRMEGMIRWAAVRCWWWRHRDVWLKPAYMDLWHRISAQGAMHTLANEGGFDGPPSTPPRDEHAMGDLPEEWLTGFHALEELEGERFRWSGPLACVKLPLARRDGVLRLRTLGVRPGLRIRAFLNGHRLAVHNRLRECGELHLMVRRGQFRADGFQYLVVVCEPLRPWLHGVEDRRELGMPLFRIVFGSRDSGRCSSGRS